MAALKEIAREYAAEIRDGIGPQEAGTIVAELVEQFGGSYATGEQFTAEVSFLLGKLRAARETEAAHE